MLEKETICFQAITEPRDAIEARYVLQGGAKNGATISLQIF